VKHFQAVHAKIILLIIYSVGVVGMGFYPLQFQGLTPLNLALTASLLIYFQENKSPDFWRYLLYVAVAGIAIEVVGVRTGKIFGIYSYGASLGFKAGNVPLIIGLNWFMLVMGSRFISMKLSENTLTASAIGAGLMVALDFLIEQVAPVYDFWLFEGKLAGLQNYIGWFIFSFFLHFLGHNLRIEGKNPLAIFIFALQAAFFALLNLLNII
jgi:bisanhydrobacterioruberin hydratase